MGASRLGWTARQTTTKHLQMGAPDGFKRPGAWLLAGLLIGAGLMLAGVEVYHHTVETHSEGAAAAPLPEASHPAPQQHHSSKAEPKKKIVTTRKQAPKPSPQPVAHHNVAHRNVLKTTRSHNPAPKKQGKQLQIAPYHSALVKHPRHSVKRVNKFVSQGKTPQQILDWAEQSAPTDEAKQVVAQARAAVASMQQSFVSAAQKTDLKASKMSKVLKAADEVMPFHDHEEDDSPATWLLSSTPSPMSQPAVHSLPPMLSKKKEAKMSPKQILQWASQHAKSAAAKIAVKNAQAVLSKMYKRAKGGVATKAVAPAEVTPVELVDDKSKSAEVDDKSKSAKVVEVGDADGDEDGDSEVVEEATKDEADKLANEESDLVVEQMFEKDGQMFGKVSKGGAKEKSDSEA